MKLREVKLESVKEVLTKAEEANEFVFSKDTSATLYETMIHFSKDNDFHTFTLTENSDNLIGITSTFPNKHPERISIGLTYVTPEYRGNGFGVLIREELIKWIKENTDSKEVFAKTWSTNIGMIRTNEKMDFKLIERKENDRKNGAATLKYLLKI